MTAPYLATEDLHVALASREVLRGLSFRLEAGEKVAIVGPNGSGKSTLLSALLGLVPASRGRVRIGEHDLSALKRDAIARAVALVVQDASIEVALPVVELVRLGRYPHRRVASAAMDRDAVEASLRACALEPFRERELSSLSGGERQRVHLARALAQQTPFLLLDESTAHLDVAVQLETLAILDGLAARGVGIAFVLHDLSMALRWADRLVLMRGGELLWQGPPEWLSAELLSEAFGVELRLETLGGQRVVVPQRLLRGV